MRMLPARALTVVLATAGMFLGAPSALLAGPIINGDFSDPTDLAGWMPTGIIVGEPTGEFAELETEGDFLRTLEQNFTLPLVSSLLSFDFAFSTEGTDSDPIVFPDSFAVSLITDVDGDFLDILVVDLFGVFPDPSDGIEDIIGAVPIDVLFDSSVTIPGFVPFLGGSTFSGRIGVPLPASVLGEDAALFFDVFDEFDGATTRASVDNVAANPTAVPEPGSFALTLLGVALVWAVRSRSRATFFDSASIPRPGVTDR